MRVGRSVRSALSTPRARGPRPAKLRQPLSGRAAGPNTAAPAGGPDRAAEDAADLLAIQQTLRGRSEAFGRIVERYTPLLYSLAYRMLDSREDAEEAVQEILLKAYGSLERFRLQQRFFPWLYTIAMNDLRSCLRARGRRDGGKVVPYEEPVTWHRPGARLSGPEELALLGEGERLAAAAIARLRPEHRQVFLLRQVEGLSVGEVSEILGLPEGTVKTFLHRARRQLVDALSGEGFS